MASSAYIKKVPPCMNNLLNIYDFSHSGTSVIERCMFGKAVNTKKDKTNINHFEAYDIYIVYYQLCNKTKMYKISYVNTDCEMLTFFFDKTSKMYLSPDGNRGCLFSTDENKLKIDTFENCSVESNQFLNCTSSIHINNLHKQFLFSNNFCSFNSNNTLLIYCAVADSARIIKDPQVSSNEYDLLVKLNDSVYKETFGEKHNYSFFHLYIYNFLNNTIKPTTTKEFSCFYNPQFIDETSFVCLSYSTAPYRLGIHGLNSRTNYLYLCMLNEKDAFSDISNDNNESTKKKSHVRCVYVKISTKQMKHILSPIVIHDKVNDDVHIACLTVMSTDDEYQQHTNECNLVLLKLAKETKFRNIHTPGNNTSMCNSIHSVPTMINEMETGKMNGESSYTYKKNVVDLEEPMEGLYFDFGNEMKRNVNYEEPLNTNLPKYITESVTLRASYSSYNNNNNTNTNNNTNSSYSSNLHDAKQKKNIYILQENNNDTCTYKKVDWKILVRAGNHTEYFKGIYSDEIKGCCFPYIFLNTILYCNQICIAVHMFTKTIYRVIIKGCENQQHNISCQILCMKENNFLLNIKNCLITNLLYYCIFDENMIIDHNIYLKPIQCFSLDFFDCKLYENPRTGNILASPNNKEKLYYIINELEANMFQNKHPYIRRRHHSFNLLYQTEKAYQEVDKNNMIMPYFNLFNRQHLRNLIVYLHGGPYSVTLNEFRSTYIFFIACGFDVICINYKGSLTFDSTRRTLDGKVNTVEIEDIINITQSFKEYYSDYENIFIYGEFYGANLGCALLEKSRLFKGASLINGIYDWALSSHSTDAPDCIYNMCLKKSFEHYYHYDVADMEILYRSSPIHFVQDIISPVLIIAEKKNRRVSYHNSLALYNKLIGSGKKCKFLLFQGESHNIEDAKNEESILINTVLWFYGYEEKKKTEKIQTVC